MTRSPEGISQTVEPPFPNSWSWLTGNVEPVETRSGGGDPRQIMLVDYPDCRYLAEAVWRWACGIL